jgi:hypothetical protein
MASIFGAAAAATARNLNNTALRSVCRKQTRRCCLSSLANASSPLFTKQQNHDVNDWTSATPTPSSQYNFYGDDSSNIDSCLTTIDDASSSESSTQIQFPFATLQIFDEDDDGG